MSRLRGNLLRFVGLVVGFAAGMFVFHFWWTPKQQRHATATPATPDPTASETSDIEPVIGDLHRVPGDWDASVGSPPSFVDVTAAAKISFHYVNGRSGKYLYPEIMGGGVGLFDYNGDGFLDVYLVNGNHLTEQPSAEITNRLYRNNGNWTFTDVTVEAGVGDAGFGHGCCVGDYDGDGDPDLYVSNYGPNVLYRNNGNGTFTAVTKAAGVEGSNWSQSSCFLDYDNDGRLDLYVQNYLTYSLEVDRGAFTYIGDEKFPDYPSPLSYPGAADRLYRNNGQGRFTDVTQQAGILDSNGKGMGVACWDMNEDGHVDVFVANDGMENYFFLNRGNGTFDEIGLMAGLAFDGAGIPESSMGVDLGDFDGDGRMDLIVPCTKQQVYTLYQNRGDHFADASLASGLAQSTSDRTGFNANFLDYDNDGDLDLFFTTGGVRANELVPPNASYDARYGAQDVLLANNGQGKFTDVSRFASAHFQRRLIGRGSATGDLDNDGDLDLVVCNLAGPAVVLRNDSPSGHWITLRLVPAAGNRDALGTVVRVEAGGRKQTFAVHPGVSFLSQSDRRVHFGLGEAARVDRLEVIWPDRRRQVLENLSVDRFLMIEQVGVSP